MNKFIGISPNKSFDFDNTQSRPNEFVASVGNNSSLLVAFLIILVSHFFFLWLPEQILTTSIYSNAHEKWVVNRETYRAFIFFLLL